MKLRIIVIDDEPSIRDTFKWHLEDLGHDVQTYEEPLSCELYHGESCQHETPCSDALLIDYHMPNINGLDFVERVMKFGCKGSIKNVLIMSGDTTKVDKDKANELGCRVAQKPLTLRFLEEWVEEVKLRVKAEKEG